MTDERNLALVVIAFLAMTIAAHKMFVAWKEHFSVPDTVVRGASMLLISIATLCWVVESNLIFWVLVSSGTVIAIAVVSYALSKQGAKSEKGPE